jgi:hypothetical protein
MLHIEFVGAASTLDFCLASQISSSGMSASRAMGDRAPGESTFICISVLVSMGLTRQSRFCVSPETTHPPGHERTHACKKAPPHEITSSSA